MKIALDAMGTDDAPSSEVSGAVAAVEADPGVDVVLVGDRAALAEALGRFPRQNRITVVHAPDRIMASDTPRPPARPAPPSSGAELQKAGRRTPSMSAGSPVPSWPHRWCCCARCGGWTSACRHRVSDRHGLTLVADVGANIECKPRQLVEFARLGSIYMQDLQGLERPRVGLLNVGTDPEGPSAPGGVQAPGCERSQLLGNVEGGDILRHACTLRCGRLHGNILLKFYESVAAFVVRKLTPGLRGNGLREEIQDRLRDLDYAEHGGAPLLGVNGVSVICHGRSSPRAIEAGIGVAARAVRSGLVAHMARDLAAAREGRL